MKIPDARYIIGFMKNVDDSTRKFEEFEVISINPSQYSKEQLLSAFRAGNIAVATALILGDEQTEQAVRIWDESVECIGNVLATAARPYN